MSILSLIALLFTLTAIFAYLNHQFIHLPPTVGPNGALTPFFEGAQSARESLGCRPSNLQGKGTGALAEIPWAE